MTGQAYLLLAYIIGLSLLWGYAAALLLSLRAARQRPPGAVDGESRRQSARAPSITQERTAP
ncbi:MAG: hypothetical protein KF817_04255 [Phycisphaeraceae bacterium]|nr:hypothetical protein [Phycisphaeraceae bacterium]